METVKIKKEDFKELYDLACKDWKNIFDEKFKKSIFTNELEFDKNFINQMSNACTKEQKPVFEKIFKSFLPKNLFHITTYKQVCAELGESEKISPFHKIKQLERLFNQEWKKDLKNKQQKKYYPVYNINDSGRLVFDCSIYLDGFSGGAGFYKDAETSNHIGINFIDIYQELADS
jgi:hypothetical protein